MKIVFTFLLLFLRPPMSSPFSWEYSHIHDAQKKSALIGGDLMIGALFPIHEAPSLSNQKNPLTCGAIREQYGIQRVEAALRTVDLINRSPDILPNITLGIEIRDTCWSPLIALHQSLQFVQKLFVTEGWYSCREKSPEKICRNQTPPILGVIGPASSEEAIQVQNLLQLFHIPQVGYSTTSPTLSDRKKFEYFVRVVPSDNYQARVMVGILKKYNWSFVFAVHSEGEYGRSGMDKFRFAAEQNNICIASEHAIYDHTKPDELDEIIRKFEQNGKAKIVVCFCEGGDVRRLLEATKRVKKEHSFVFIGSDGWAGRDDVVKDIEDLAQGNLMISIHSPHVADFDRYYFNVSQRNDSRNPWLDEFRNLRFNCSMEEAPNMARCTGKESMAKDYVQDPKLSFIIKSIYALAHALHRYRNDICGKNAPVCSELYPINGTLFMEYLQNVSFVYNNEMIEFNEKGEPTARYDILNFQRMGNGSYEYVKVGSWIEDKFEINTDEIQLPGRMKTISSVCSKPCSPGYKKFISENGQQNRTCCWSCIKCKSSEVSDGEICHACDKGFKPNNFRNECIAMDHEYIHYSDLSGIVCTVFSTTGICLTLFTMLMFYKFGDTPVVKSSTKELCYMMFAGMILAHSCTFILVGKPTTMTCVLARIIPGVSLSVMYSALLVKTNRISRILSMSKKRFPTLRPKFMSTISQVYICGFLISFEFLICVISIYLNPARVEVNILQISPTNKAILECYNSDTWQGLIFQFIFDVILLLLCTLYAFKTRKLPDNFNEAKCIGFACYATLITWLAFVSIYLGSPLQILSECISLSISAMINLIFLFFPKLYIMLCKPEKNTRSFFTTTKNLRCHFGSTYLIQNYEQIMSKMLKNGFLSNGAKFTDMNQFNEKVQEYHTNQMNSKLLTPDSIATRSCQTSLEEIYFKIPDPPSSNNENEDILPTTDEQEMS